MSQNDRSWNVDPSRTRIGMECLASPQAEPGVAPGLAPRLGARIGRTGQIFETDRGAHAGRLVVKLFPWARALPAGVVQKFTREALTVANLRHPHVAQLLEAGRLPDGTPFVVMERLAGRTLEERWREHATLPAAERRAIALPLLLPVVRGVASALSAAHALGVVHRELRADDVFVAELAGYPRGFPKLLDFGVARLRGGAPASGDSAADGAVDPRGDQRALGALAYRLFTGGDEAMGELDPGGWSSAAPAGMAPALATVLGRAMSRRAEDRFESVASFFAAFEQALAGPSERAVAVPPEAPRVSPRLVTAPEPASLTQQFFAEGERQDTAAGRGREETAPSRASADPDDAGVAAPGLSGLFDRVPRRRAPFIAAAALALAALAIAAHSTGWLARDDRALATATAEAPAHLAAPRAPVGPAARLPANPAKVSAASASQRWITARPARTRTEPPPLTAAAAAGTPAAVAVAKPTSMPAAATTTAVTPIAAALTAVAPIAPPAAATTRAAGPGAASLAAPAGQVMPPAPAAPQPDPPAAAAAPAPARAEVETSADDQTEEAPGPSRAAPPAEPRPPASAQPAAGEGDPGIARSE